MLEKLAPRLGCNVNQETLELVEDDNDRAFLLAADGSQDPEQREFVGAVSMKLLSLQEAANSLGYTVKGLRKIVDRSRAKANGARTRRATIRFFQAEKGSPTKFKQEWIEEFVERYTVDPAPSEWETEEEVRKGGTSFRV